MPDARYPVAEPARYGLGDRDFDFGFKFRLGVGIAGSLNGGGSCSSFDCRSVRAAATLCGVKVLQIVPNVFGQFASLSGYVDAGIARACRIAVQKSPPKWYASRSILQELNVILHVRINI